MVKFHSSSWPNCFPERAFFCLFVCLFVLACVPTCLPTNLVFVFVVVFVNRPTHGPDTKPWPARVERLYPGRTPEGLAGAQQEGRVGQDGGGNTATVHQATASRRRPQEQAHAVASRHGTAAARGLRDTQEGTGDRLPRQDGHRRESGTCVMFMYI